MFKMEFGVFVLRMFDGGHKIIDTWNIAIYLEQNNALITLF